MGVIGVQSIQKQAVDSSECSLVDWSQSTQQHAVNSTGSSLVNRLQPAFISSSKRIQIR